MTDADRARLLQTLVAVCAYYDRDLTDVAATVWLEDLAPYPVEAIEQAFVAHRRDPERGQWMPRSADILRHLRPSQDESATVAWAALLRMVRDYGAGTRPPLDGPTREAVHAVGGWGAICRTEERELPHLQRRFAEAFRVYAEREHRVETVPALAQSVAAALRLQ